MNLSDKALPSMVDLSIVEVFIFLDTGYTTIQHRYPSLFALIDDGSDENLDKTEV